MGGIDQLAHPDASDQAMEKIARAGERGWAGNNEQWFRQLGLALITSLPLGNILMGNISLYLLKTNQQTLNVDLITMTLVSQ